MSFPALSCSFCIRSCCCGMSRDRRALFDAPADKDTMRILLATDIHLGVAEKDGIRADDSFRTFDEIMKIGQLNQVDFVLLGGDLFHENKPSRLAVYNCMETLNKYCLGSRPVSFQVVSDQAVNFPNTGVVNYEDENINIGLPIFSIHGNHDDPSGFGGKSPMDILATAKLVNYFGTVNDPNDIEVMPVLIQKGESKLALYGIGALRDERLHRTFQQNKVKWARPAEDANDWFNIFVIHQNRVKHSSTYKNVISETMLPKFIDLVFWGHEHECQMELQKSEAGGFFVVQPGSSVVTSLMPGEAIKKHIFILEVKNQKCRLLPVPLLTVRPFVIENVELAQVAALRNKLLDTAAIETHLAKIINSIIERVPREFPEPAELAGSVEPQSRLPLIRLRVDYTSSTVVNVQRFGAQFVGKVANPNELLLFHKKRVVQRKENEAEPANDCEIEHDMHIDESVTQIQDYVAKNLQPMQLLPDTMLAAAVQMFVDKNDTDAIDDFVNKTLEDMQKGLLRAQESELGSRLDIEKFIKSKSDEIKSQFDNGEDRRRASEEEMLRRSAAAAAANPEGGDDNSASDHDEDEEEAAPSSKKAVRGRKAAAAPAARGRGRGGATKAARGRGAATSARGKKKQDDDEDIEEVSVSEDVDMDDDDYDAEEAPTVKKSKPVAASKKRKAAVSSSDEDIDEPPPKRPVAAAASSNSGALPAGFFKSEVVDMTQDDDFAIPSTAPRASGAASVASVAAAAPAQLKQRTLPFAAGAAKPAGSAARGKRTLVMAPVPQ